MKKSTNFFKGMVAKSYALILFLLCLNSQIFYAQVFSNADVTISVLGEKSWIIETSDHGTMYLVEGSKRSLLIDTGSRCKDLDKIIKTITSKPLDVVLTHGHGDHAGNIRYFDTIYIHPADKMFFGNYKGKINYVEDKYLFDLGDRKIEVRHMPAHTQGSIVLVDWKGKCCYTGDAFGANEAWLQLTPIMPMQAYIDACNKMEKIMNQGIPDLYCGHHYYVKKPIDKKYMDIMKKLATDIVNGRDQNSVEYSQSFEYGKPRFLGIDGVGIVYYPNRVK